MKLATVVKNGKEQAGVVKDNNFYPFTALNPALPNDMLTFIEQYDRCRPLTEAGMQNAKPACALKDTKIICPLPNPKTIRDFVGFEGHCRNCSNHFGAMAAGIDIEKTVAVWKKAPGFYFTNTNALYGNDEPVPMHPRSKMFDFEFEIGFIIGKKGRDIPKEKANDYIFGFTIFNDWSARDIQLQEVQLGVGAPLGKGYANGFGPVIVTKDEFDAYLQPGDPYRYNVKTKCFFNGKLLSENNLNTIYYTFADMIAWASLDTDLVPGDILGSGTIAGSSLCEQPPESPWLKKGDVIEMEAEGIGTFMNVVS